MDQVLSLFMFASIAGITPGPNNIMIMSSGLNFGIRASMPHYFGICCGFPLMLAALGFGAGIVFDMYPVIHQGIQVAGITYLLYLSWLIARSAPAKKGSQSSVPLSFAKAALFQWVNPKAWVMGSSAMAAYTTVGGNIASEVSLVLLAFTTTTFAAVAVWLVFGVSLQRLLAHPKHRAVFNVVMALLLVASILPIAASLLSKGLS